MGIFGRSLETCESRTRKSFLRHLHFSVDGGVCTRQKYKPGESELIASIISLTGLFLAYQNRWINQ
jgi:hypothetical protein